MTPNPRRVSLRDFVPAGRSFSRWRASDLPDDVVFVGRPSRWGNPFKVGEQDPPWCGQIIRPTDHGLEHGPLDRQGAVYHFRLYAIDRLMKEPDWLDELHGMRLACYDPADDGLPCHTDVLLELGA